MTIKEDTIMNKITEAYHGISEEEFIARRYLNGMIDSYNKKGKTIHDLHQWLIKSLSDEDGFFYGHYDLALSLFDEVLKENLKSF